ncbi:hypothetical protein [Nevskia sp.]|uniref:chorismate transformation enzyme, FkbO/Hyg5 family n=1 Tax=Nevskia sp. TaxID=1929292 RepID=UPI0025D02CC6|nr:hypothetical protein [Nevskia sp.]
MFSQPPRAVDATLPIRIRYSTNAAPQSLASFAYGPTAAGTDEAALHLHLPPHGDGSAQEHWLSPNPVTHRAAFGARIAEDGSLLYAAWTLDEAAHGGIEAASAQAYRQIAALLENGGYPHPIKIWHYLGAINEGTGDDERYRRFCVGRASALVPGQPLPAATAVGLQAEPDRLTVFLLAAKVPGIRIENPRQVPAYEYPRAYGPVSPSFSRAMLMPWGQLFVSGTAAVVGHETKHPESTGAQLRELALNLDALVAKAESIGGRRLAPAALKVYVRRPEDLAEVEALAARLFPADCPRLTVLADISRADLRVEVEALYDPVSAS